MPLDPNAAFAYGEDFSSLWLVEHKKDGTHNIGGSSTALTQTKTQAAHGFTVGFLTPVRWSGTAWVKAQADSAANADVWGLAVATDANTFTLYLPSSYISGFTAITAGVNYLSASSAGTLTTTAPSTPGQVEKVVFMADSTTSGYFEPLLGVPVDSSPYAKQILDASTAITVANLGKIVIPSDLNGLKVYACEVTVAVAPSGNAVTVGLKNNAGSAIFSTNPVVATTKHSNTEAGGTAAVVNVANATLTTGDVLIPHGVTADASAADRELTYWLRVSA